MISNYGKGREAEILAKTYMEQRFACAFEPKELQVGIMSDGKPAKHNFDLVSPDCRIVAEVKAHTMTCSGNNPSGKISNTYEACSMLEKVEADQKFLFLTDPDFCRTFKKCSDGKIDRQIVIQLIPKENDKEPTPRRTKDLIEAPKISIDMTFDILWRELGTFLANRRPIRNWTVLKGYIGEGFEAVYNFGKVVVYPESATVSELSVQSQDFNLIFNNWFHERSFVNRVGLPNIRLA
jgi:hypothetical protein